jgi:hypothetical protein
MTAVPYMTDAEFADLEPIMESGWATLGEWYENLSLTFVRQGGTTIGTLDIISIKRANRQANATGGGTPVATTEQAGTLRLWTADIATTPIRQGDRFLWQGQACVIDTGPYTKRGGASEFTFIIEQRSA